MICLVIQQNEQSNQVPCYEKPSKLKTNLRQNITSNTSSRHNKILCRYDLTETKISSYLLTFHGPLLKPPECRLSNLSGIKVQLREWKITSHPPKGSPQGNKSNNFLPLTRFAITSDFNVGFLKLPQQQLKTLIKRYTNWSWDCKCNDTWLDFKWISKLVMSYLKINISFLLTFIFGLVLTTKNPHYFLTSPHLKPIYYTLH